MTIEIRGVGFVNKGAELMLHAILQKIRSRYPKVKFVMAPSANVSPYIKRAEQGLYQKVTYEKAGIDIGDLIVSLIPKKRREMYGLVRTKEIDIVLDAAGFAHGDQWGVKNTNKLLKLAKKYKKNNTQLILLPQAFGPFENQDVSSKMSELASLCDLVFTREELSYKYLKSIVQDESMVYNMPDFTNLVTPKEVENFDFQTYDFCIIPNYKMVSKNWNESESDSYLDVITTAINYLRKQGKTPFILVHEGKKDMSLAQEISKRVNGIEIFKEEDPLKVKGILNGVSGVIGSRFHSLVSALSQATPALGTSWSHKYQMLFKDYGFEEGILGLDSNKEQIESKIDMIINQESQKQLIAQLEAHSKKLKNQSEQMWKIVFKKFEEKVKS